MTELEQFTLDNATDGMLAHVGVLKNLRVLNLSSSDIGDEAIGHIKSLDKLERLNVSFTNVTAHGLRQLRGLKHLKEVKLVDGQLDPPRITHADAYEALPQLFEKPPVYPDLKAPSPRKPQ